jgi:hypothetical protein
MIVPTVLEVLQLCASMFNNTHKTNQLGELVADVFKADRNLTKPQSNTAVTSITTDIRSAGNNKPISNSG